MSVKWDIICLVSLTLIFICIKYRVLLYSAHHLQNLISRKSNAKKLSEDIMINNMMESRGWITRNKANVFSITAGNGQDKKKKGLPKTAAEWKGYGRTTSELGKVKMWRKRRLFQLSDWIKYWKELYSRSESVTVQKWYISPYFRNLKYCPIHLLLHAAKRIVQFHGVMHLAYFRYFLACDELSLHMSFPISKTCSIASTTAVEAFVQLSHIWQGKLSPLEPRIVTFSFWGRH